MRVIRLRLLWVLVVILSLISCRDREHTVAATDDWGRGRLIDVAFWPTSFGLAVTPDGSQVSLVFPRPTGPEGQVRLALVHLDAQGRETHNLDLDLDLDDEVRTISALAAADGTLKLFWFEGFRENRRLRHALLDRRGGVSSLTTPASGAGGVSWYRALATSDGIDLWWLDGRGRLFRASLVDGRLSAPTVVRDRVVTADLQRADDGEIHLAWSEQVNADQRRFFYARLPAGETGPIAPEPVARFGVAADSGERFLGGPVVALDQSSVYIAWARQVVTPLGTVARPAFVARSLDPVDSAFSEEQPLMVTPRFPPPEQRAAETAFPLSARSLPAESDLVAPSSETPVALPGQAEEAVLAMPIEFQTRSRRNVQPTMIYLRDGRQIGYQALTWTDRTSRRMVVQTDVAGRLYVLWFDSDAGRNYYPVYLMTTAPGLRAAADRLSANDYGYLAVDYLGRIGNGISLVFLTISWPITAFVFLFLVYWFTEGEIYGRPAYFILTLSVLIYISMKFIFLNDISAAIPGLAFLSPDLARLAIWGTPFAVALFSSLVTWLFYLRREGADFSVMRAYLSIVLLDFALSMAIYSIGHFE